MKLHSCYHERTGWQKVIANGTDMGSVQIWNPNQHHVTLVNTSCLLVTFNCIDQRANKVVLIKVCVWGWKVKITRVHNLDPLTLVPWLAKVWRMCEPAACIDCVQYFLGHFGLQVLIFHILWIWFHTQQKMKSIAGIRNCFALHNKLAGCLVKDI